MRYKKKVKTVQMFGNISEWFHNCLDISGWFQKNSVGFKTGWIIRRISGQFESCLDAWIKTFWMVSKSSWDFGIIQNIPDSIKTILKTIRWYQYYWTRMTMHWTFRVARQRIACCFANIICTFGIASQKVLSFVPLLCTMVMLMLMLVLILFG